jgi:hypothetical protein
VARLIDDAKMWATIQRRAASLAFTIKLRHALYPAEITIDTGSLAGKVSSRA